MIRLAKILSCDAIAKTHVATREMAREIEISIFAYKLERERREKDREAQFVKRNERIKRKVVSHISAHSCAYFLQCRIPMNPYFSYLSDPAIPCHESKYPRINHALHEINHPAWSRSFRVPMTAKTRFKSRKMRFWHIRAPMHVCEPAFEIVQLPNLQLVTRPRALLFLYSWAWSAINQAPPGGGLTAA